MKIRFLVTVKNRIKYRNKCVLYIQKIVRGFLARKQHQPRYRGIIKINSLKETLQRSTDIVNQLRGSKDQMIKQANEVEHLISGYVRNIQNDSRINPKTIDQMYTDIITKIDNYNNMLQSELQVRYAYFECKKTLDLHMRCLLSFRNSAKLRNKIDCERFKKLLNLSANKKRKKNVKNEKKKSIDDCKCPSVSECLNVNLMNHEISSLIH